MPETLDLLRCSSALAIGASALVIGQRNPMYSVLLLIASFGALAGLYIQLDAPFVAVAQIIIYAGAIMVLFLFVVMLLNAPQGRRAPSGTGRTRCGSRASTRLRHAARGAARRAARLGAAGGQRASDAGRRAEPTPTTVSSVRRARAACSSPTTRSRSRRRRS